MYNNGDSLKKAYKKFSIQSEYGTVFKGQLKVWAIKKRFLDRRSNIISTTLYGFFKTLSQGLIKK